MASALARADGLLHFAQASAVAPAPHADALDEATASFRDSLHGQRKHPSIVGRAVHPGPPTPATTDLAGEPFFDVLLLGEVAL
jgi:hypothetical protein